MAGDVMPIIQFTLQNRGFVLLRAYARSIHGASGVETAPSGCSKVRIWVIGAGGAGGYWGSASPNPYSGASGGAVESEYAISPGQTLNWSLGIGGSATSTTAGFGTASTVTSGTLSITTMLAEGGNSGTGSIAQAGGTGGNIQNLTGSQQTQSSYRPSPPKPYSGTAGWESAPFSDVSAVHDSKAGFGGYRAFGPGGGESGFGGAVYFLYT